jgi:hypothetical protein
MIAFELRGLLTIMIAFDLRGQPTTMIWEGEEASTVSIQTKDLHKQCPIQQVLL